MKVVGAHKGKQVGDVVGEGSKLGRAKVEELIGRVGNVIGKPCEGVELAGVGLVCGSDEDVVLTRGHGRQIDLLVSIFALSTHLHVLSDIGVVDKDRNAEGLELRLGTNARHLKKLRGLERAGADDDLTLGSHGVSGREQAEDSLGESDAGSARSGASRVEEDLLGQRSLEDVEIRASACCFEERSPGGAAVTSLWVDRRCSVLRTEQLSDVEVADSVDSVLIHGEFGVLGEALREVWVADLQRTSGCRVGRRIILSLRAFLAERFLGRGELHALLVIRVGVVP